MQTKEYHDWWWLSQIDVFNDVNYCLLYATKFATICVLCCFIPVALLCFTGLASIRIAVEATGFRFFFGSLDQWQAADQRITTHIQQPRSCVASIFGSQTFLARWFRLQLNHNYWGLIRLVSTVVTVVQNIPQFCWVYSSNSPQAYVSRVGQIVARCLRLPRSKNPQRWTGLDRAPNTGDTKGDSEPQDPAEPWPMAAADIEVSIVMGLPPVISHFERWHFPLNQPAIKGVMFFTIIA